MATTTPDNIRTPNPSDPYNLVSDLAIMANDVQSALTQRANMYIGTSSERGAFTSAPEGTHWQDTNGEKLQYVRKNSDWEVAAVRPGWVCGTSTQRAQRSPVYGEIWQDTNGSKYRWIGSSSGTWRRASGELAVGAGAWSSSSGTTLAGRTVSVTIPTVLEENEILQLSATNVGNGFGTVSLTGVSTVGSASSVTMRQMQFLNVSTNGFRAAWQIVQI